ncbi:MAG: molecular chaperone DnaK, partial [Candidatus Methanomethylophilaceae archaeon]|nr:molecular chaperone DnaK [Candidatus Methanomethylophilaceae archaeon]
ARNSKDIEQVKQKMDALYKAMEPISQKLYQQEQAQQQAGGPGAGPGAQQQSQESQAGKDGDFVDADYKIVDDE